MLRTSGVVTLRHHWLLMLLFDSRATCRRSRSRLRCYITPFSIRVGDDSLIHTRFDLSLTVTVVQFLSDPLINFDEFNQFLVELYENKKIIKENHKESWDFGTLTIFYFCSSCSISALSCYSLSFRSS